MSSRHVAIAFLFWGGLSLVPTAPAWSAIAGQAQPPADQHEEGTGQSSPSVKDNGEPAYVLVDRSDPAFVLFQGIPQEVTGQKLDQVRTRATAMNATLISWEEFRQAANDYARKVMLRNDYPQSHLVEGIICLVRAVPGVPWSITWNGGIAFTHNDYEWAKRQYKSYNQNPSRYRPVSDPRLDPVNPAGFLPAFACP